MSSVNSEDVVFVVFDENTSNSPEDRFFRLVGIAEDQFEAWSLKNDYEELYDHRMAEIETTTLNAWFRGDEMREELRPQPEEDSKITAEDLEHARVQVSNLEEAKAIERLACELNYGTEKIVIEAPERKRRTGWPATLWFDSTRSKLSWSPSYSGEPYEFEGLMENLEGRLGRSVSQGAEA